MAQRFGGKYSPKGDPGKDQDDFRNADVEPAAFRVNLLFVPPAILLILSLGKGALALTAGAAGAAALLLAAWLLREGLRA